MLLHNTREGHRQCFYDVWQKHHHQQDLSPLEQQIWQVICHHPEYHFIFANPDKYLAQDYQPEHGETNPFLHMGFHLALIEQLSTDRPKGIRQVYQQLCAQHQDTHQVEHRMIDCLMESLWQAQRHKTLPDEKAYLHTLRQLLTPSR